MTFNHGVTSTLLDTTVRSVGTMANPIAYIGTAKISGNTSGQYASSAGKWERLQTRAQALSFLGTDSTSTQIGFELSARATGYTIPGFLSEFFDSKKLSDICVYNVAKFTTVTDSAVAGSSGSYTLANGYVKDLTVTDTAGTTTYVNLLDYTFDHKTGVILAVNGGNMTAESTIVVDYKYADTDVSNITVDDVVQACTDKDSIYQQHEVVPSIFIAPTFTQLTADTTYKVVSALKTCTSLNDSKFAARAIVGIEGANTTAINTAVSAMGTGLIDADIDYVGHPAFGVQKLTADEHYALAWMSEAAKRDGIIGVRSASNILTSAAVPSPGFSDTDGNTLNQEGINTFTIYKGLRTWGNYTSKYSTSGEFMDNFSSIRFIYISISNNCNEYARQFIVDGETNTKKIEYHVSVMQRNFIDKYIRAGGLLQGSTVSFNSADNPTEDLLSGKYVFNFALGFIPPATYIENKFWYNTDLLVNLFG